MRRTRKAGVVVQSAWASCQAVAGIRSAAIDRPRVAMRGLGCGSSACGCTRSCCPYQAAWNAPQCARCGRQARQGVGPAGAVRGSVTGVSMSVAPSACGVGAASHSIVHAASGWSAGRGRPAWGTLEPHQGSIATTDQIGAFSAATLGATLARTVVGDSSQFIPRTIAQVVDGLKAIGGDSDAAGGVSPSVKGIARHHAVDAVPRSRRHRRRDQPPRVNGWPAARRAAAVAQSRGAEHAPQVTSSPP